MNMKSALLAATIASGLGIAALIPQTASASTATSSFLVKLTIQSSCSVAAGTTSNIDFGSQLSSATNLAANNNISVTCSKGTAYNVGLLPTNTGGTASGTGVLTSTTSTDTVPYSLWQNSGHSTPWGNTVGTNTLAETGTGAAQSWTVYATVASANYTPASYQDTVTVTVTY